MNKVSILVPLYGAEHYIVKCARHIFSQSYANCEFIFVDDASTDRSLEMLKVTAAEFPHVASKLKIIELPINGGVAEARNQAIDAATGEYILFVDADDWVDTEIVERLAIKTIEEDADICNAWCESVMADNSRQREATPWLKGRRAHIKAVIGQSHIVPNHLRGMLIRRSLFTDNNLRFTPRVDFGEDYSLLPQLLYHAKHLATLPEYLYYYRVENQGSYMNNIAERHIKNYVEAQRIVSRFVLSLPDAHHYRRAVILGRVNIKKWIFKRGDDPKLYHNELFGSELIRPLKHPRLWIYDKIIDTKSLILITMFSVEVNLWLFVRVWLRRLFYKV